MVDLIYTTGLVSVNPGNTIIVGNVEGPIWSLNIEVMDQFCDPVSGYRTDILEVIDDRHLRIPAWGGPSLSNAPYRIAQNSPARYMGSRYALDVTKIVRVFNSDGFYVFVPPNLTAPDPSWGDDGQYARQETTGKEWAKQGGAWVYLGIFKGVSVYGAYSSGVTYPSNALASLNGTVYRSLQDNNTGHSPNLSPSWWEVFVSGGDRYDIAMFDTDKPTSNELVQKAYPFGVTFPVGLPTSFGGAEVAATGTAIFRFMKNAAQFATLTFAPGSAVGVWNCPVATTFDLGDALRILAPAPQDATLAGIAFTIIGYRTS